MATDKSGGSDSEGDPGVQAEQTAQDELRPVDPRVALLQGHDARTILERIGSPEDPLGIGALSSERVLQLVVFLDHERVALRALARIAHEAVADPHAGRPNLHGWLVARVDQSVQDLIREDYEALRLGRPFTDSDHPYYAEFSELTGIEAERVHETCTLFNLLDPITREAFYCIVFEQQPLEMYARAVDEPVDWVEDRVATATTLFEAARQDRSEDPDDE